MRKRIRTYLMLIVSLCFKQQALGQIDPHFTQNYIYPMAVNPALTGAIDGDYRVATVYRNQWGNITNPYRTIGLSADFATKKKINFGLNFFRQTAGDAGYELSSGNFSVSYNGIKFGRYGDQEISFGLQGGFIQTKFNAGAFRFGSQWLPGFGYDGSLSSGENLGKMSSLVPDISFGVSYFDRTPDKKIAPFLGLAAFHLTKPKYSFQENQTAYKLPIRISAQAGLKVAVNEGLFLVPNIIYNKQQKASELVSAVYAQFYIKEETDLMIGGNMRHNDSVSPFVGVYIKGLIVGLSYDVNTGPLKINAPNSNAFELSISFSGGKRNSSNSPYFNCPRF